LRLPVAAAAPARALTLMLVLDVELDAVPRVDPVNASAQVIQLHNDRISVAAYDLCR